MKVLVRRGNCVDFAGDAVLFFHYSDIRPLEGALGLLDWRCNAIVSRLLKEKKDLLEFGRMSILATQGKIPASKALITGLGPFGTMDSDLRAEALRIALKGVRNVGSRKIALDTEILERGFPDGIREDLERILPELDPKGALTLAVFHPGKRPPEELRDKCGNDRGTTGA